MDNERVEELLLKIIDKLEEIEHNTRDIRNISEETNEIKYLVKKINDK